MLSWEWAIIGIYGVAMFVIFAYSLMQLSLLIRYWRRRETKKSVRRLENYPHILVQLPVFNEYYVVERLIDAAVNLHYPKDKLHIQVLDDSTDESFNLAGERVRRYKSEGFNIEHVRRPDRKGFKAGALQYGLKLSDASYVVVFDADFVPESDFILRTIPEFENPEIGMVQTRWGHLNRHYSLLTRVQAFALDAHFTVEQMGRNLGSHFINFNGTAGIWRRECIDDAGGWSADTLTEDLDLSYRAQLKGWKFKFLEDVISPAELPAEMNALKNQQYRWNKGAAECYRKHLKNVLKSRGLPLSTRLHALFHLGNSSVFIWIMICAVLSLPLVYIKTSHPEFKIMFALGGILLLSFAILGAFYYTSFRKTEGKRKKLEFLWMYPAFLSLSMGMSLHNARAVWLGYMGKRTPFIRTPKWNIVGTGGTWSGKKYLGKKISLLTWIEGFLILYFAGALVFEILIGEYGFIPLHLMLIFGFSAVFIYSIRHSQA
jgi:cellulose synthase/poly-beta-1,6-N-acetylglucosamine synthase-like glycosyltransferase